MKTAEEKIQDLKNFAIVPKKIRKFTKRCNQSIYQSISISRSLRMKRA